MTLSRALIEDITKQKIAREEKRLRVELARVKAQVNALPAVRAYVAARVAAQKASDALSAAQKKADAAINAFMDHPDRKYFTGHFQTWGDAARNDSPVGVGLHGHAFESVIRDRLTEIRILAETTKSLDLRAALTKFLADPIAD